MKKQQSGGKILVPEEPDASIIKECLERFADGRFESQMEIKQYLEQLSRTSLSIKRAKSTFSVFERCWNGFFMPDIFMHPKWDIIMQPGKT